MVPLGCGSPRVSPEHRQPSLLPEESPASQRLRVAQGRWGWQGGPGSSGGEQSAWVGYECPSWVGMLTQGRRLSVEVCLLLGRGSKASRCLMAAPHLSGIQ